MEWTESREPIWLQILRRPSGSNVEKQCPLDREDDRMMSRFLKIEHVVSYMEMKCTENVCMICVSVYIYMYIHATFAVHV